MSEEKKLTHWKKNNDPRYISGEDLKDGEAIGKGLRAEMVVTITHFEDSEVFDKNQQKEIIKTGMFLATLDGKNLYKPVILNNTNAAFCIKEFGSSFMEHWLNKPLVLWAMPDKRHVWVARFKKYYAPATVSDASAMAALNACDSLAALSAAWAGLSKEERALPTVAAKKEELKATLK